MAARILPILAVAAWVVMLWVPVLDSSGNSLHTGEVDAIVITSLGSSPISRTELEAEYVVIWVCLLTCAISVWLVDRMRTWSWVTAAFGVLVLLYLGALIAEPPSSMWDGVDSDGNWMGGMEVADPAIGAAFWVGGCLALIAAGICGLLGGQPWSRTPNRTGMFTSGARRGRLNRFRSAAGTLARVLPMITLIAWVVMIWVPIMKHGNPGLDRAVEDSLTVTSLGRHPLGTGDFGLEVLLPWLLVIFCAAALRLEDPPVWVPVIVTLSGIVLSAVLTTILLDPPTARVAGVDSVGMKHGAIVTGIPADGVGFWHVGSAALAAAGIAGLISAAEVRSRTSGRAPHADTRAPGLR